MANRKLFDSPDNYFEWHYAFIPVKILHSTLNLLIFFWHFFSIGILLKTLFSPWKRQIVTRTKPGLDLGEIFERITFNLISRVIGAMVRVSLILFWLVLEIITIPLGLTFFSIWIILPLITLPLYFIFADRVDPVAKIIRRPTLDWKDLLKSITHSKTALFFLKRLDLSVEQITQLPIGPEHQKIITAKLKKLPKPTVANVWYLLAKNWPPLAQLLKDHHYTPADLKLLGLWFRRRQQALKKSAALWDLDNLMKIPPLGKDLAYGYTPNLDRYCLDLARPLPYSHHLVGRTKTTKQMEQILSRSTGNNIILVGEPGVGRNTIVEELAKKIKEGMVTPSLTHRKVYSFGLRRLLSEKKSLTEAKGLVEKILAEAAYAGNIILVIETFDRFISNGAGRHDLTALFNQASQRGTQIIGVTTPDDFARYIYPNQEVLKHFQKVEAEPPTKQEAQTILEDTLYYYEKRNGVFVTYAALKEVIEKVDKYVVNIPFPEKAIDLLDETCVWASQNEIKTITPKEINKVISVKTKIPLEDITQQEKEKLAHLEDYIHERVIDQEEAVTAVSRAMRRARTGISKIDKPIGSFLFMGPTGVGKTETAKALAEAYFGSDQRMIRFDMSEYQSQDALERIIGNVKTGQPGLFAKRLRNNPFSLLLLDEIEKTTPQVLNLFLTMLDEGYFTDTFGKKVDCRNLIIIGTSNAGTELIRQKIQEDLPEAELEKTVVDHVQKKGIFSPEFLNRFDAVVIYRPLSKQNLLKIARLMLD
ncbi:AAA family ATPase, partial [Patescibacteria group bacterium]|nr:AAA family ATPase [Patescibacteria group bacterium]